MRHGDDMTARDFVPPCDFEKMRRAIAGRELFEHKKTIKADGTLWTIRIDSSVVGDKLAKDIWNDNNYLVCVNIDYNGKAGQGGVGFATVDYDMFSVWGVLQEHIDGWMQKASGYEKEEYGQMALF